MSVLNPYSILNSMNTLWHSFFVYFVCPSSLSYSHLCLCHSDSAPLSTPSLCPCLPLSLRVVGGSAFQPYLPEKDSLHGWAGLQTPRMPRQSVETLMMSPRSRVPQEALLTPVCDMGALGGAVQAPVWDTALRQGVGLLTTRGRAPGCHADRPPAASSAWRRDFLSIPAIDRTIF